MGPASATLPLAMVRQRAGNPAQMILYLSRCAAGLAWIPTDKTGPNIFARGLALTENQSEGPIV